MIKVLSGYGLSVENKKRHLKIFRKDGVGPVVYIAHTPSDSRAWSNSVYYIIKLIETDTPELKHTPQSNTLQ